MKTVYLLWWNNGEEYDDSTEELIGIFSGREVAERYLAKLILAGKGRSGHPSRAKYEIAEREFDPAEVA